MLTSMLNPRFKGLKCVIDFFSHEKVKLLPTKYNKIFFIPLLVKCNHFMNSHVAHTSIPLAHYPIDSFFDITFFGVKAMKDYL